MYFRRHNNTMTPFVVSHFNFELEPEHNKTYKTRLRSACAFTQTVQSDQRFHCTCEAVGDSNSHPQHMFYGGLMKIIFQLSSNTLFNCSTVI